MIGRRRTRDGEEPSIADPTIPQIVEALHGGPPCEAPSECTVRYWAADGYAYEALTGAERQLFDGRFNAEGPAHRDCSELFGPSNIVPALRQFFGWFLTRKVMGPPEHLRRITEETRRFVELGHARKALARVVAGLEDIRAAGSGEKGE